MQWREVHLMRGGIFFSIVLQKREGNNNHYCEMECALLSEHRLHCEIDQINPKSSRMAELRLSIKVVCMLEAIKSTHNNLVFILQLFVTVVQINFQY